MGEREFQLGELCVLKASNMTPRPEVFTPDACITGEDQSVNGVEESYQFTRLLGLRLVGGVVS